MGDDIGMWNIGAYHRGMMAGRTPNLDKLAKEGMLFTDYYAEASCTAGRANFITGELPIRTGMTTVGQAGAKTGYQRRPARSPPRSKRRATPPVSSARTISAIATNSCRPSTASTSSSATSITWTRWKTRRIPTIRRICWTRSARATWSTAGPRTRTTRPRCRAGARSASRRSKTPARFIRNGWRRWTTRFAISP